MNNCIFCKIAKKEMDTNIIYEDEQVIAFDDIDPKAPQHKLIIPKRHIDTLNDFNPGDEFLLGHLVLTAQKLAKKLAIDESGYRVVFNCNRGGGQAVFHVHLHLLGGRTMHWPPG